MCATDEAIALPAVSVLTVLGEIDGEGPSPGPISLQLQPKFDAITLEGTTVMDNI